MKNFKTGDIGRQIAFQGCSTYLYYRHYYWMPISIPSSVFSFSNPYTFECCIYLVVNCIYVIASKLEIFSRLLLTYFFLYICPFIYTILKISLSELFIYYITIFKDISCDNIYLGIFKYLDTDSNWQDLHSLRFLSLS